jgi:phosphate starvation-inducible membrane PsiE
MALIISFSGVFYVSASKKKLSNENLIEFERNIRPKLLKFLFLSFIPLFIVCIYLINSPEQISLRYFIYAALTCVALNIFGYFQSKKIMNLSPNSEHFKFALNYFIFITMGILFILAATAYNLNEYFEY